MSDLLFWTIVTGVVSALATGLGALPVIFIRNNSERVKAISAAFAGGMMLSASLFLVAKDWRLGCFIGLVVGWLFLRTVDHILHGEESGEEAKPKSTLLVLAMFCHSIPEGVAIGTGFATGDLGFGLLIALAIAVHNIPEGVAISLALSSKGKSMAQCAKAAVFSSLPQPVLAVPALLFAGTFIRFQPVGLGFAAGAMFYLVFAELIPEALEEARPVTVGLSTAGGFALMVSVSLILERLIVS